MADEPIPEQILAEVGPMFEEAVLFTQLSLSTAYSYVMNRFDHSWKILPDDKIVEIGVTKEMRPVFSVDPYKFKKYDLSTRAALLCHVIGHFMCGHVSNLIQHDTQEYCIRKYGMDAGKKLFTTMVESMADTYVVNPIALVTSDLPYIDVRLLGFNEANPPTNMSVLAKLEEMAGGSPDEEDMDQLIQALQKASAKAFGKEVAQPGAQAVDGFSEEVQDEGTDLSLAEHQATDVARSMTTRYPQRRRGLGEGQMEELIRQRFAPPKAPYQQLLMHSISAAISEERRTSKTRLNRRLKYFMGRVYENTTKIVFIVDTSGSMTHEELQYINSQLRYIVQLTEELYVIQADYGVQKMEKYHASRPLELFSGRGGTAFMPALTYVAEQFAGDMPQLIVYLTDGEGERLDSGVLLRMFPHTGLVWLLTPGGLSSSDFRSYITQHGRPIKIESWR